MKKHLVLTIGCVAALAASAALAQGMPPGPPPHGRHHGGRGGPGGPGGPRHAEMAQRMHELRGQLLRKEAGLQEAAAVKAEAVLDRFDQERQKGRREMGEARRALRELADQDAKDEAAWGKALNALVAANQGNQDLRSRELDELRKVLSQRDTARVVLALERIQQMMRREGKQARKAWLKAEMERVDEDDDGADGPPPPPGPPPAGARGKGAAGSRGR